MRPREEQMATEKSDVVPEGIDPNESPYELQAVAGLPFGKDSVEAKAIRKVLEEADRERALASRGEDDDEEEAEEDQPPDA